MENCSIYFIVFVGKFKVSATSLQEKMDLQKNSSKRCLQAELWKKSEAKKETEDTTTFFSVEDPETVLLIDKWEDETALDEHHKSPMMKDYCGA